MARWFSILTITAVDASQTHRERDRLHMFWLPGIPGSLDWSNETHIHWANLQSRVVECRQTLVRQATATWKHATRDSSANRKHDWKNLHYCTNRDTTRNVSFIAWETLICLLRLESRTPRVCSAILDLMEEGHSKGNAASYQVLWPHVRVFLGLTEFTCARFVSVHHVASCLIHSF